VEKEVGFATRSNQGLLPWFATVLLIPAVALLEPANLDTISIDCARIFDGRVSLASFIVGKPSYSLCGFTIIGTGDLPAGSERSAILKGTRPGVAEGMQITVIGVLRVIGHPARGDDGAVVAPGWK
jgi:hypothetical protein